MMSSRNQRVAMSQRAEEEARMAEPAPIELTVIVNNPESQTVQKVSGAGTVEVQTTGGAV